MRTAMMTCLLLMQASVSAAVLTCDDCSRDDMSQTAIYSGMTGLVHVADLSAGKLQAFELQSSETGTIALPTSTDPVQQSSFEQLMATRQLVQQQPIILPDTIAVSPWQLLGSSFVENDVVDFINQSAQFADLKQQVGRYFESASQLSIEFPELPLRIQTRDQGTLIYTVNGISVEGQDAWLFGLFDFASSTDGSGNAIELPAKKETAEYSFANNHADTQLAFETTLKMMTGIRFKDGLSGEGKGFGGTGSCSQKNQQVNCQISAN